MSTVTQTISGTSTTGAEVRSRADKSQDSITMSPRKGLARIAGFLWLVVGISGGFAQGFMEPKMYAAGNAAATAANVVANPGLVRLGVVAELVDSTVFIFLAMTLYILLKHVHKSVARAMVVLVALSTGISCLNTVFEFEGLRVAIDSAYAAAFSTAGSNALVLLLLDTQHYGTLIAQVFFGLWLVPLGYLAYKSLGMFPKWLGVLLIVGGVCSLVDLLVLVLVPDFAQKITPDLPGTHHTFVGVIPPAIAEISMLVYLLVIGVKTVKPSKAENSIPAAVAMPGAEA